MVAGLTAIAEQVRDGSQGPHDAITLICLDIGLGQGGSVQDEHLGQGRVAAETKRYGHVQPGGHHVGEFMNTQRGLMGKDTLRTFLAVAGPE